MVKLSRERPLVDKGTKDWELIAKRASKSYLTTDTVLWAGVNISQEWNNKNKAKQISEASKQPWVEVLGVQINDRQTEYKLVIAD